MTQPTKAAPAAISVREAAAMLGVSLDAVYDAIGRGEIQAVRVGRRLLVARAPLFDALGLSIEDAS